MNMEVITNIVSLVACVVYLFSPILALIFAAVYFVVLDHQDDKSILTQILCGLYYAAVLASIMLDIYVQVCIEYYEV